MKSFPKFILLLALLLGVAWGLGGYKTAQVDANQAEYQLFLPAVFRLPDPVEISNARLVDSSHYVGVVHTKSDSPVYNITFKTDYNTFPTMFEATLPGQPNFFQFDTDRWPLWIEPHDYSLTSPTTYVTLTVHSLVVQHGRFDWGDVSGVVRNDNDVTVYHPRVVVAIGDSWLVGVFTTTNLYSQEPQQVVHSLAPGEEASFTLDIELSRAYLYNPRVYAQGRTTP